jgi:hypothetical protein
VLTTKSARAPSKRSFYRAEKFIVLRARFELLSQSQGLQIPVTIATIFARVPPMAQGVNVNAYLQSIKDVITWADIDALEEAVVAITPAEELPEQLEFERVVYSQTVAVDEFTDYQKRMIDLASVSRPVVPPIADQIRSEWLAVLQRVKYMLIYGPPKEQARSALTSRVILTMLLGVGLISILYIGREVFVSLHQGSDQFVPSEAIFVVLCAGLVGGFISVQQRLQQPTEVDPLYKWLELDASGESLLISPVIGMIFAMVLYAIFVGGFLKGDLFPTFLDCVTKGVSTVPIDCQKDGLASLTYAATPDIPASWAKLTVWAFAAGFLERLVPDILTRIGAVAEKS